MENNSIGMRLRMINNAVRRYIDRYYEGKKEIDNMTCSNGWIIGIPPPTAASNKNAA